VTEQRVQRRLAAILAADVVGYSALMERDEEATYAEFERLKRELIKPSLSRHEGRLIKTTGVCTEKLNPRVVMVKSGQDGVRTYGTGSLNRPRIRRIFV
jgi:class 3 adenylate cyclase